MDKNQLKQYQDLCKEIKLLENRINKLESKTIESDMVTGSNPHFPYQQITFHLEGEVDNSFEICKHKKRLRNKIKRANRLKVEIENWIDEIFDSRIRMIFEMRYIENRSWIYISRKFGSFNESYARMAHDRFLDKVCYNEENTRRNEHER